MRLLTAALILLAGVSTAAADIRIDQSRYQDGKLTIAGITKPDSTVTLDNKYKTKSDTEGNFKFTEHYKPFTCMSNLRDGTATYSAVIAGCLDPGFDGNTMPVKKAVTRLAH